LGELAPEAGLDRMRQRADYVAPATTGVNPYRDPL